MKYIDAAGVEQTRNGVIVLTGSETTLGEDDGTESSPKEVWYICDKNLSYSSTLESYSNCNVNIIVADGVEMKVESTSSPAISFSGSLGIYGQNTGTNMGKLIANGTDIGISSSKDITICSAEVTATGDEAIHAYGSVSITGGKVTANGTSIGINAYNGVVLDWTDATDFIMASSYDVGDGVVKTAEDRRFVAFTVDNTNPESPVESFSAIITGTVSDLSTIDGKMLRPLDGCVSLPEGLNIVGKTPYYTIGSTSYYNIAANENVTVAADNGLGIEITGTNVPAGTTFNADNDKDGSITETDIKAVTRIIMGE